MRFRWLIPAILPLLPFVSGGCSLLAPPDPAVRSAMKHEQQG